MKTTLVIALIAFKSGNMKKLMFGLSLLILTAYNTSKPTKNIEHNDTSKITGIVNSKHNADTTIRDSLKYVKSILSNKEKYIGKEFSVLIKDLTIQIKSYSSNHVDLVSSSGILISFDDWTTSIDKLSNAKGMKDPVLLAVEWQNPISRADVETHLKRAAGEWGEAEQEYFSKLIVKDIR